MTDGDGEEPPPEDDRSISDETDLYRRVPPDHYKVTANDVMVREGAFKNFPNPELRRMSVVLGDTLAELGRDPSSILEGHSGYGLVAIKAGCVRSEGQAVQRTPLDDEAAHGDVVGDKPAGRRKRFAKHAEWVIRPEQLGA